MRTLCAAVACLVLASCSPVSLANKVASEALTGGSGAGTDVNANVLAGLKNSQTVGASKSTDQKIRDVTAETVKQTEGETAVHSGEVERIYIENNNGAPWLIVGVLILTTIGALFVPKPTELWAMLSSKSKDSSYG